MEISPLKKIGGTLLVGGTNKKRRKAIVEDWEKIN
tara:strand:+ start:208 stop:312 length:105 start_codon:yes stop_codon:yes gene_type:complete